MKNLNLLLLALLFLPGACIFGQMEVDHPIQLTGIGSNAQISGIKYVANAQDATSAELIQKGILIYGTTTGSGNSFQLNLTPPITSYQTGMAFNFISNQKVTGPATLNVNNLGSVPIKKNFNADFSGCEIQIGQVVTVVYDGTNFQMTSTPSLGLPPTVANAGPNQLNVAGSSVTLAANTPSSGTGSWSIVSGSGGSFSNASSPTSTFTGGLGTTYVLKWTITTGECGTSSSNDTISFQCHGSQSFTSPGGPYTFSVPACVSSVTIACYGAQGQGYSTGGYGGYATGVYHGNPGDQLYVFVGGQDGTNGGGQTGAANHNGGGMSNVCVGSSNFSNVIIVAGGGGGSNGSVLGGNGGGGSSCGNGAGGGGGQTSYSGYAPAGNPGTCTSGGSGGSGYGGYSGGGGGGGLTSGGTGSGSGGYGNAGGDGSFGQGGGRGVNYGYSSGGCNSGCGGGGGYYGGGGAADGQCAAGGAGGGSSWASSSLSSISFTAGTQSGNGQVVITW